MERNLKYTGYTDFLITMSFDGSDFLNKTYVNIYDERLTLDEKMITKLTLEQQKAMSDVIGRLNSYLKRKAEKFYRYV